MKIIFRLLACLCAFAAARFEAHAVTVQYIIAIKLTGYTQTSAAGDFIPYDSVTEVLTRFASAPTGTSGVLNGPSGPRTLTALDSTSLGLELGYASGAAMEAAFPAGNYTITLSGTTTGTFPFTFGTGGPAAIRVTNYAALQHVVGSSATITWDALPISPAVDSSVLLQIYTLDDQLVWDSTGLSALSTSATATGLPTNQALYGFLSYSSLPATTSGGVQAFVSPGTLIRFSLVTATPPIITTQPLSQALNGRPNTTLSVAVTDGTGSTSYQWNKDGVAIPGATSSTYTATSPGFYTVTVTNSAGSTTSNAAIVNATAPAGDARLYALSCRAKVGTGGDILIPGIAIGGTGSRQVVVRASGPAIQGVSGTLARPQLTLYQVGNSTPIASNTGWSTGTAGATAALQAAFTSANLPQYPVGSADCALLATVTAGNAYTATISGVSDTTGVALVEVYEVGAGAARMTALSCRAQVGTGGDILIPGIIIAGATPKQVIIRAKGPGIQGVAGVLAQPTLSVYSGSGVKLSENTGWTTSPDVAAISTATAACGLIPFAAGSGDCAILVTLPPGGYTAQVSGLNSTTGVALIEVYEVP